MLIEQRIIDGKIVEYSKVDVAIQRLKSFDPADGYYLAFSGGKDSVVIKALADMAGVKYEAHYSLTTVDPPELVRFIKTFPDVTIDRPLKTMWQLIVENGPPTRLNRFCCKYLKESHGIGWPTITGVRWAESINRKANRHLVDIGSKGDTVLNDDNDESRRIVENCYRTKKTLVNPIIDWSDDDVWEFIHQNKIRYCCLYDEGFTRLGCIGCPMNTRVAEQFERWPTYKTAYTRALDRFIARRKAKGNDGNIKWKTGQECFVWCIQRGSDKPDTMDGQIEIEESEDT